jgi:predicted anti-sigma-YlaC factor YlaD
VAISEQLTREDPDNIFWRTRGYLGRAMLAMELYHSGDTAAALTELQVAESGLSDLLADERNSALVRLHLAHISICRAYFQVQDAPEQSLQLLSDAFATLEPVGEDTGPVHFGYYMQAVLVESAARNLLGRAPADRVASAVALMSAQGQPEVSVQDGQILSLLELASGEGGPETAPKAEFYRRIYQQLSV